MKKDVNNSGLDEKAYEYAKEKNTYQDKYNEENDNSEIIVFSELRQYF